MNFIINTFLGLVSIICLLCIINIYGTSAVGFVIVLAFVFMSILIMIIANRNC